MSVGNSRIRFCFSKTFEPSVVSESCRKLRLEDLNYAIDSTENKNLDDPNLDNENMEDSYVHLSPEKAESLKDVGPSVGTSVDQQAKHDNDAAIIDEDLNTDSDHENPSGNTTEKSSPEEVKHTEGGQAEVESDPEVDEVV